MTAISLHYTKEKEKEMKRAGEKKRLVTLIIFILPTVFFLSLLCTGSDSSTEEQSFLKIKIDIFKRCKQH